VARAGRRSLGLKIKANPRSRQGHYKVFSPGYWQKRPCRNTVWIYPPRLELGKLFAAAPARVMDLSGFSVPINTAAA